MNHTHAKCQLWARCPLVRHQLVLVLLGCSGHDPMMDFNTAVSVASIAAYMCLFIWRAR